MPPDKFNVPYGDKDAYKSMLIHNLAKSGMQREFNPADGPSDFADAILPYSLTSDNNVSLNAIKRYAPRMDGAGWIALDLDKRRIESEDHLASLVSERVSPEVMWCAQRSTGGVHLHLFVACASMVGPIDWETRKEVHRRFKNDTFIGYADPGHQVFCYRAYDKEKRTWWFHDGKLANISAGVECARKRAGDYTGTNTQFTQDMVHNINAIKEKYKSFSIGIWRNTVSFVFDNEGTNHSWFFFIKPGRIMIVGPPDTKKKSKEQLLKHAKSKGGEECVREIGAFLTEMELLAKQNQ